LSLQALFLDEMFWESTRPHWFHDMHCPRSSVPECSV